MIQKEGKVKKLNEDLEFQWRYYYCKIDNVLDFPMKWHIGLQCANKAHWCDLKVSGWV